MSLSNRVRTYVSAAGRMARAALLLLPLAAGYLAGLVVRLARLILAAVVEGYELGRRM